MWLPKLKYNATLLERKLYNYTNVLFSNQLVMLSCSLQAPLPLYDPETQDWTAHSKHIAL